MSVISTRPRGRPADAYGPTVTKGIGAVDEYLIALEQGEGVDPGSLAVLERGFVRNAKHFADCRGVTYAAWRDVGVPVEVLARAGIFELAAV